MRGDTRRGRITVFFEGLNRELDAFIFEDLAVDALSSFWAQPYNVADGTGSSPVVVDKLTV